MMLPEKQQRALDECDSLQHEFVARANRNKLRYRTLQYMTIGLALATTALASLSAAQKLPRVTWLVPVSSALTALSTILLTQTSAQRTWILSRGVAQKLQAERFLYLQSSGQYARLPSEEAQLQHFAKRTMTIWNQAQDNWVQTINSAGGQ